MVKGYDPTVSDPSKIVLEYLLRWSTTSNPLTLEQAEKYTKHWLKNSQSTSQIYKQFSGLSWENVKKPEIVLKKKCSNILDWFSWKMLVKNENQSDQNYPAYTDDNKVVVCLNQITNKTQLKQNIDRQLTILLKHYQSIASSQQYTKSQKTKNPSQPKPLQTQVEQRDKQLMQFIYQGCRQGYKNYMLDKEIEERISKKCAKYLFFRRCKRQLPYDAKFRYTSKIIEEIV